MQFSVDNPAGYFKVTVTHTSDGTIDIPGIGSVSGSVRTTSYLTSDLMSIDLSYSVY